MPLTCPTLAPRAPRQAPYRFGTGQVADAPKGEWQQLPEMLSCLSSPDRDEVYAAEYFFVPNPLNCYTLSSRFDFKKNEDDSVDFYIRKDSPGADKEANWLPAPAGKFILMLHLYWPKETPPSIIDGSWKIPPVRKVD